MKRPTALAYTGATQGHRGRTVTLSASLTDVRLAQGLDARSIDFTLGSFAGSDDTNGNGSASVDALLNQPPGAYTAAAEFDGNDYYVTSGASAAFSLDWEYVFPDALGRGTININVGTREWQLVAGSDDSGIIADPGMTVLEAPDGCTLPHATMCADRVLIAFNGPKTSGPGDITLGGEFDLETGMFTAFARTDLGVYQMHSLGAGNH